MVALYVIPYIVTVLICFIGIVLSERKKMYIDQEALLFMTLASFLWPVCAVVYIIVQAYKFLERVVNIK